MATVAERNAAFTVAETQILAMVKQFVPSMFEGRAEEAIKGNPAAVLAVVDAVLAAAEKARAAP